jgi:hypothetical protein
MSAQVAAKDTAKVASRRQLRFQSVEDVLRELDRIAEAERAGRLECLGNWTCGQILGHLATWAEYAYNPAPLHTPWFVRIILRLRKNKILNEGMSAGVIIPRVPGGTLGTELMPLDQGLARYRAALERLRREPPTAASPAFGPLTHDQAIKLNLRHAELHLGFVRERS